MTTPHPHDEIELRLAEAAASGEPPAPADAAHAASCASCARLQRSLRALADDLDAGEPDELRWRRIDEGLRRRIAAAPSRSRVRAWLVVVPLAAALALAAILFGLRTPGDPVPEGEVATTLDAPAEDIVAAASADSLELELMTLGLDEGWNEETEIVEVAADEPGELPAPAWGDVLGELEEEMGPMDPGQQRALADALRQAS